MLTSYREGRRALQDECGLTAEELSEGGAAGEARAKLCSPRCRSAEVLAEQRPDDHFDAARRCGSNATVDSFFSILSAWHSLAGECATLRAAWCSREADEQLRQFQQHKERLRVACEPSGLRLGAAAGGGTDLRADAEVEAEVCSEACQEALSMLPPVERECQEVPEVAAKLEPLLKVLERRAGIRERCRGTCLGWRASVLASRGAIAQALADHCGVTELETWTLDLLCAPECQKMAVSEPEVSASAMRLPALDALCLHDETFSDAVEVWKRLDVVTVAWRDRCKVRDMSKCADWAKHALHVCDEGFKALSDPKACGSIVASSEFDNITADMEEKLCSAECQAVPSLNVSLPLEDDECLSELPEMLQGANPGWRHRLETCEALALAWKGCRATSAAPTVLADGSSKGLNVGVLHKMGLAMMIGAVVALGVLLLLLIYVFRMCVQGGDCSEDLDRMEPVVSTYTGSHIFGQVSTVASRRTSQQNSQ